MISQKISKFFRIPIASMPLSFDNFSQFPTTKNSTTIKNNQKCYDEKFSAKSLTKKQNCFFIYLFLLFKKNLQKKPNNLKFFKINYKIISNCKNKYSLKT